MIVIRTKNRPFGQRGFAWLWPFAFVWIAAPPVTAGREKVHGVQWLECWMLAALPISGVMLGAPVPWWSLAALLYSSYWIVYGLLWCTTVLTGTPWRDAYWYHPMAIDAREYAGSRVGRQSFNWLRWRRADR